MPACINIHETHTTNSMQKHPKPFFFFSIAHSLTRTKNLKCVTDMERYEKKRSGSMRQGEMRNFPARNSSAVTETWGAQDAVETDHWEQTVVIAVYFKKNTTCHHTPKWKSVSSVDDKQNGVHLYMKINGLYSVLGNQH